MSFTAETRSKFSSRFCRATHEIYKRRVIFRRRDKICPRDAKIPCSQKPRRA
nr:MAG TPA: hypothetical protein [Caudoviricetes sp.]